MYPRLYFLSDEDLLELVSGSEKALETHLPKLYQGIGLIKEERRNILAIISPEGEVLKLSEPVNLDDPLPIWLFNLETRLRNTLQQSLEKCLSSSTWDLSAYPTQVKSIVFVNFQLINSIDFGCRNYKYI
ncbi:hypothetical protein KM043_004795 [Ampulex compressa]|nr:hypothetical protein KM043_004795 [Ampulex compressa]